MPTVQRIGGHRFFFYANEGTEPPHVVHIQSGNSSAKFWLAPVALARSSGYDGRGLFLLRQHVEQHRELLERAWHEFFHRYWACNQPHGYSSMVRRGAALGSAR